MSRKSQKKRLNLSNVAPARILSDAAIASVGIGEGRMIPLLILDAAERPDIAEVIRVHRHLGTGDVNSQWGQAEAHKRRVALILRFQRPIETDLVLEFDIVHQGGIVDQILISHGLYIQAGQPGDRLYSTFDHPRILLDISDTGFGPIWDELLERHTVADFRARGLPKAEARDAARDFIQEWRGFSGLRMKG